jgi:hypothetical protein
MPNTLHAYAHMQSIYPPIAVGVFVLVVGTLLVPPQPAGGFDTTRQ